MDKGAARIRIRQICGLGLGDELLVASVAPAIRDLVDSEAVACLWTNSVGEVTNAYSDRHLSLALILLTGPVVTNVAGTLRFASYGCHALHAVVPSPEGGQVRRIALYRPACATRFCASDAEELQGVLHYIAHGIERARRSRSAATLAGGFHDSADEAVVVSDRHGVLKLATDDGRRMLLLASGRKLDVDTISNWSATTAPLLRSVVAQVDGASGPGSRPAPLVSDTAWGRFVLQPYWLHDDPGAVDALLAVRIHRQEPTILRFVRAISALALSPQQREIALMIVRGQSNREIARSLSVSCNTVAYHVKQLFWKLNVHDRAGLVETIAGRQAADENRSHAPWLRGITGAETTRQPFECAIAPVDFSTSRAKVLSTAAGVQPTG